MSLSIRPVALQAIAIQRKVPDRGNAGGGVPSGSAECPLWAPDASVDDNRRTARYLHA